MLLIPTIALAQGATPPKRPTVGTKPLIQAKPRAPVGCKLVGTVKGTKLWAGRMHGGAGPKKRYASRRAKSDVDPRRNGRGHSEGSVVTQQFMCNLYSITTNQEAIRALFRVMNRYVGNWASSPIIPRRSFAMQAPNAS